MSYATIAQVREVLARDSIHVAATAASLSDPQIQDNLDDATSQVNSALGYAYPTPFGLPYPQLIVNITRDIAAYLSDLTFRGTMDYSTTNSPILLRYARAMQQLKDLAAGAAKLIDWPPPGSVVTAPASNQDGQILGGFQPTAYELTAGQRSFGPNRLARNRDWLDSWGQP